jgi:fido (protein-threonine AMPylation protein)
MRLNESLHDELIRRITASNLERQVSLLRDFVQLSISIKSLKIDGDMVCALHGHATIGLVDKPGCYRDHDVWLRKTGFQPPNFGKVRVLMREFYPELHKMWEEAKEPFSLAAFALWKLCWIHPFEDGNGRTARAVAYHIICVKLGGWLSGKRTLLERIKLESDEYQDALKHADRTQQSGAVDLEPLALLLSRHTADQILDID